MSISNNPDILSLLPDAAERDPGIFDPPQLTEGEAFSRNLNAAVGFLGRLFQNPVLLDDYKSNEAQYAQKDKQEKEQRLSLALGEIAYEREAQTLAAKQAALQQKQQQDFIRSVSSQLDNPYYLTTEGRFATPPEIVGLFAKFQETGMLPPGVEYRPDLRTKAGELAQHSPEVRRARADTAAAEASARKRAGLAPDIVAAEADAEAKKADARTTATIKANKAGGVLTPEGQRSGTKDDGGSPDAKVLSRLGDAMNLTDAEAKKLKVKAVLAEMFSKPKGTYSPQTVAEAIQKATKLGITDF